MKLSKFLSFVLRHRPDVIGLSLDECGWADINELINNARKAGVKLSLTLISQIVTNSEKQRFTISLDGSRIRANQGYSIPVDLGLLPLEPPELLYHGTARRNINAIFHQGILKGNRLYVHLSPDKETALSVGKRHGEPVVLVVHSGRMWCDGIQFFLAANGVWMTDFVAPNYMLLNHST